MKKQCSKCGEWKKLKEFWRDWRKKDGHDTRCKECVRSYRQKYEYGTPKTQERRKRYYQNHGDKVRLWMAQSYKEKRAWRFKYPKKYNKYMRAYNNERHNYDSDNLTDDYVKRCLIAHKTHIEWKNITPEMIQDKREQLMVYRALKQYKEAINE